MPAGGVSARVRSKQATGEAMGLKEVGAPLTRPRHTWETGRGGERERTCLKRQREAEVDSCVRGCQGGDVWDEVRQGGYWNIVGALDSETLGHSHLLGSWQRGDSVGDGDIKGLWPGTKKSKHTDTAGSPHLHVPATSCRRGTGRQIL